MRAQLQTQLKVRTEYSFRTAYGPIEKVVDRLKVLGCQTAAITDRNSTFGHVAWQKECRKAGIKPLFGVELSFTPDLTVKERRPTILWATVIAKNQPGLTEIYSAVEESTRNFYRIPRLPTAKIADFSSNVIVLINGNWAGKAVNGSFSEINPYTNRLDQLAGVPISDNFMMEPTDRDVYEAIMGRTAFNRPSPMHILDQYDLEGVGEQSFLLADRLGEECDLSLPIAENVKINSNVTLKELCILGARSRGIELNDVYMQRLDRELNIIAEKQFEDYFFVLADLISWSKQHMLVGPARGSSCGSLVCYLTGITDIDPIPHELIFERFIDITRKDLPDIDVDFQDNKRELAFEYLAEKYGAENVARLGTISRYKPKSAIGEAAKMLNIPPWETAELKNSILDRSTGDSRANFCIADTLQETDIGRSFLKKYPAMMVSSKMEAHARHHGMHAAGVVITDRPLINFVSRDLRSNTIQMDKRDAEVINLLKIDALGLKTLTIIAECLQAVGLTHEDLLAAPLDCDEAFAILRNKLWCGIFQFEGNSLQSIAARVHIDRFTDISALTALARPGPFASGASGEWLNRRMGLRPVEHFHPLTEAITGETYGLVVYQEQVMRIAREVGLLSWEETSTLRKAMSKSLGVEFFDTFWERFKTGALSQGFAEPLAKRIWDNINTMGSWAFNKSHSVAYGMLSYWCCYLKAKFPLEFALAYLKHTREGHSVVRYLRELDRNGQKFVPFDIRYSEKDWCVKEGMLVGGLINVKGIGQKTADRIVALKEQGKEIPFGILQKLLEPVTAYDNVFEARRKFPKLLAAPQEYGIASRMTELIDIDDTRTRKVVFIAKVVDRNQRSLNETMFLAKRNGMKVPQHLWLNLVLEDDTSSIQATVGRFQYEALGKPLLETYKVGDWFIFKGTVKQGQRRVFLERYKLIHPE